MSTEKQPERRLRALASLGVIALAAYVLIGAVPVSPVESDALAMANCVENRIKTGHDISGLTYRRDAQPLTYTLTRIVAQATGQSAHAVLSILSVFACLIFLATTAILVSRAEGMPASSAGLLLLLLFPETWTCGYFGNSSILAAALGFSGLTLLVPRRGASEPRLHLIAGAVLLALGAAMRLDLLLLLPSAAVLLWHPPRRSSIRRLSIFGAAVASGLSLMLVITSASPVAALASAVEHFSRARWLHAANPLSIVTGTFVISHISVFTLAVVGLIAAAIPSLARRDSLFLGIFIVAGAAPVWIFYTPYLTSPKYLLYTTPFACIAAARGWRILRSKISLPTTTFTMCLLIGAQAILGIRFAHHPCSVPTTSLPTLAKLFESPQSTYIGPLSLVIGAGSGTETDDGPRFLTGYAFAPVAWSLERKRLDRSFRELRNYLSTATHAHTMVSISWDAYQVLHLALLDSGYSCTGQEVDDGVTWLYWEKKDDSVLTGWCKSDSRTVGERVSALRGPSGTSAAVFSTACSGPEPFLETLHGWRNVVMPATTGPGAVSIFEGTW